MTGPSMKARETARAIEGECIWKEPCDTAVPSRRVRLCCVCESVAETSALIQDAVAPLVEATRNWPTKHPNHAHQVPGVWDSDNGPKAGTRCKECARYAALSAALDGWDATDT